MNIEILRKGNHCINSYASKKRRRLIKHSSSVLCGHILTNLASFKKVYGKKYFPFNAEEKCSYVWSRLVLRFILLIVKLCSLQMYSSYCLSHTIKN